MGPRILLVDDHPGFRRMARRILEAGGFDVVGEAADGAQALRYVDELSPEIVVLDVLLPDIDGIEVADRLARLTHAPVVVLISSRSRADLGDRLAAAPVRGFLTKEDFSAECLAALTGGTP
ncbi:hypothetical protein Sme01_27950 [Sphaerisporangium melleum]|uniref:Response regulatory domain-containing protein n=1 Tax=Sphaerisporangium melleum TaxID=321316 RepID=A0A917QVX5_9ACTN|nr:response regulator transcription factor [Sphaerisporangium melleum]GGK70123.1 hypothetical protein GCM10007964_11400 [Sphaerisporangium melleum]GII70319.1 hypothetical protein Sme01_27950 [Sphaerisporangium melleum]